MKEHIKKLLDSGYVRAVVEYKDGSVWLWTEAFAFDYCGMSVPAYRSVLGSVDIKKFRGHDDSGSAFGRRSSRAAAVYRRP